MKRGLPPTAFQARTGLFTPPGMTCVRFGEQLRPTCRSSCVARYLATSPPSTDVARRRALPPCGECMTRMIPRIKFFLLRFSERVKRSAPRCRRGASFPDIATESDVLEQPVDSAVERLRTRVGKCATHQLLFLHPHLLTSSLLELWKKSGVPPSRRSVDSSASPICAKWSCALRPVALRGDAMSSRRPASWPPTSFASAVSRRSSAPCRSQRRCAERDRASPSPSVGQQELFPRPPPPPKPGKPARRTSLGAAAEVHVRQLRRRREQPVRPRRLEGGRQPAGRPLQPALHLRRRGARQDAPGERHRPPGARPHRGRAGRLPLVRVVHERAHRRAAPRSHGRVQGALPPHRRADRRRRAVPRRPRAHPGGVLPHLQLALRRRITRSC